MRFKKISIVIPVFNEEKTLRRVLREVGRASVLDYKKEIIVVDDGSSDESYEILKKAEEKWDLVVLRHKKNLGKGAAVQTGFKKVSGEVVVIQDADLEYDPGEYEKLLQVYKKTGSVVYGSRNIKPKRKGYVHFVWGVWFLTWVNNLLYGSSLTDVYTCYKLFPAKLIKSVPLQSKGFEFEAEVTAKILKMGERIEEVAINYSPRGFGEGKKIRIKDGLTGLWTMLRLRF